MLPFHWYSLHASDFSASNTFTCNKLVFLAMECSVKISFVWCCLLTCYFKDMGFMLNNYSNLPNIRKLGVDIFHLEKVSSKLLFIPIAVAVPNHHNTIPVLKKLYIWDDNRYEIWVPVSLFVSVIIFLILVSIWYWYYIGRVWDIVIILVWYRYQLSSLVSEETLAYPLNFADVSTSIFKSLLMLVLVWFSG